MTCLHVSSSRSGDKWAYKHICCPVRAIQASPNIYGNNVDPSVSTGQNLVMCFTVYWASEHLLFFLKFLSQTTCVWLRCPCQGRPCFFTRIKLRLEVKALPSLAPDYVLYLVAIPSLPEMPFLLLLAGFSHYRGSSPEWSWGDVTESTSLWPTLPRSPTTFLPEATKALPTLLHGLLHGKNVCVSTHAHGLPLLVHHPGVVPFHSLSSSQNGWLTRLISGLHPVLPFAKTSLD